LRKARIVRAGELVDTAMWMRTGRWLGFVLFVALIGMSAVEIAYVWKAKEVLAAAARDAAKTAVSMPLNSKNCTDFTPCPIEQAAATAKRYLTGAGFQQASCIEPKSPSFSGVLVWVFSCNGSSSCTTKDAVVCLKVDMTPVTIHRNGTLTPLTRVTVQCPHRWVVDSVLTFLPGRLEFPLPKSVSASALVRD
jgi:hypothetical protein